MSKPAAAKKQVRSKSAPTVNSAVVTDIINKVKANAKKMDKKFDSLAQMCSGEKCRVK